MRLSISCKVPCSMQLPPRLISYTRKKLVVTITNFSLMCFSKCNECHIKASKISWREIHFSVERSLDTVCTVGLYTDQHYVIRVE
jgi:hypothetical protein